MLPLPKPRYRRRTGKRGKARTRSWRPAPLTWLIVICGLCGIGIVLYPSAAAWLTQYNQSKLIIDYQQDLGDVDPSAAEQLMLAHEYNDALIAGVDLEAGAHVPTSVGNVDGVNLDYDTMLTVDHSGLMARLMIPSIDVDIPVYHGTDDDTLLKGAGHLEGSHLPVGGTGTRSVITAHRGLATATMFTNLDKVVEGDTFSIQVFDEVLSYRVIETRVIEPEQTDALRAVAGEDLVTLITCTPLGVNTHRILVTGERVNPTPARDLDRANEVPEVPRFPWWLVAGICGTTVIAMYLWRSGYRDGASRIA